MEKRAILTPEELQAYMDESTISLSQTYIKAPEVLKVGDSVLGTLGNFSVSIGKAKSKKTFNVSAMIAAALSNGSVLHYRAQFPEDKRFILYFDTEQGQIHCQKVLKRLTKLLNLPEDADPDNLLMVALRKYDPNTRVAIIEALIGTMPNVGLVVIDGVRDLLYDINNPHEATAISSLLMRLTFDKQIHIHTILHQNKGDENARGHIGTELNNKAESVIKVEVDKDDKSISVVESVLSRDRDFEPFAFCINEDILPELVEDYSPTEKGPGRPKKPPFDPYFDISESVHRSALEVAFKDGSIGKYQDLRDKLQEGYESQGIKMNHNKAVALAKFLRNKRMILQDGRQNIYNPDFVY